MTPAHPALQRGRAAVITGGASGVGLAAGRRFAGLGLSVLLADVKAEALEAARAAILEATPHARVEIRVTDVADPDQVAALRDQAFAAFGEVAVLMNNAGVGRGGHAFERPEAWARLLAVNLGGVINGVQAFTQAMIDQNRPALIINTGSKQGITTPPGDTAYNVSKAGVKVLTEGLQHSLRNTPGCRVAAHLLVPGFTFTGMTRAGGGEKPAGAWTADQVIDFMLERIDAGDFYILCPDNDVDRALDNARITWAAGDITQNRPPLSRWHDDHKAEFAAFVEQYGR